MKLRNLIITFLAMVPLLAWSKITITEANGTLGGLGFARSHDFPVDAEIFTVTVSDADTSGHRELMVEVSVHDLDTGNAMRTSHMRMSLLDRKKYPLITFKSQLVLPELAPGMITLPGTLQVNGINQSYDLSIDLKRQGDKWQATGSFLIVPTDFDLPLVGMGPMKLLDKVELDLDVTF